jgi:hypothetical protein
MQGSIPHLIQVMLNAKAVTAADTIELRRQVYSDARIGEMEADCLFALNAECTAKDASFVTLFVEALTDYVVFQMNPEGYTSEANALWLIKQIDLDGKVDSVCELDLLINILEKAKSAPDGLCAYALRQVQHAVVAGPCAVSFMPMEVAVISALRRQKPKSCSTSMMQPRMPTIIRPGKSYFRRPSPTT